MRPHLTLVQGGFLKNTEEYLLSIPGIADASVWLHDDQIMANVIVLEGYDYDERMLKTFCARELGLPSTPSTISLRHARLKVA
ncbi:MAG: hypothetical protein JSS72_02845 [Armatimonadetes bacterium]|nr:hypothetical protein [Armatimonadota bacterium]